MAAKQTNPPDRGKKRHAASVYDAVAGRVGYQGFLTEPRSSKYRDTADTSSTAISPEEVLFRRQDAPVRYEENDIYFANRTLRDDQRLPTSDLLKAIHVYASDYYASKMGGAAVNGEGRDFKSLDETALLAMGVLLEEAVSEVLGETGYLALLEKVST